MHIADGILSTPVCVGAGVVSAGAVSYSLHRLKDSLADRAVPLTGMMSALVFAGQMVNFPLLGAPVSGHLMGGVLAAAVLGPWAGCLAITLVLIVQAVLFADGGLLALGANVLNMAVIGSLGGYAIYSTVRRWLGGTSQAIVIGAVVAAWLSVMAAAALFCVEFGLSHAATENFQLRNVFTLMVLFHSGIGVGEALITGAVLSFVLGQRPDLLYAPHAAPGAFRRVGRTVIVGTVCALAVAAFFAPFASEFPDGLEAVAERIGFAEFAQARALVLDDYAVPLPSGDWQKLSVSLAGVGGTLSVLMIALVLGRLLRLPASSVLADAGHGD